MKVIKLHSCSNPRLAADQALPVLTGGLQVGYLFAAKKLINKTLELHPIGLSCW